MHAAAPKPVESSTLSKSQTSLAGQQQKKDLIEGKTSIIDLIFPMCDEMLKSTYIPKFLYYILFLFITIEIVSVSFWIQLPNFTDTESLAGSILKYFWMISFFSNLEINQSELTTRFVITTIITIIYFSILIIQGLIYHNQRRFIKWTLFLTRFFIEFIPIICLCPLGNFIGQNIYVMIRERATYSIIYFVFNLIYLCCFLFAHYLMSYLFAASTYISTAPTACWSGTFHFIYIVGVSLFPLFAYILQSFANWMNDVLIVIKIAFNFFIMWNTTFLPFVNYHTNTIIASLFTALVPLDIMALIHYNGVVIATHWKFLAFIVVFAGSFGIWRLLTNFIVRKVRKNLSRSALEGVEPSEEADPPAATSRDYLVLTDVVERQHYLNLQLHKSELKAELYLRIGISTQCSLFLDWSLMKFIAEYHNNNRMLSLITQYLSYFPCEIRLLNYFFFTVMSKPNLRVDQRFMIYQVHHVKGLRQSSASSEITDKLMEMKAKSLSGINDVRNFWLNVPMDPSFLYNIRKNTNHTCALFKESIDRWPNNCRLCEDYSTYLIECATNFTEGLKIKHRSELIEQGKNFVVDLSFRSLVRSYPQYLKGGFMDIKGNVLNRNMSGNMGSQRSQNSSGSQTSQMSTGTMDGELDLEIEEQFAKASFSFHRLRLAYQRSLQYRKSHTNQRLKYLSILATALSIAVVLFLYIYYYNIFQERSDNMEQQLMLNHFRYGFDSAVATVVTHWANRNNLISDELLGNETFGLAMKSPKTNDHNLQFSSYKHVYDPKYGLPEKDFNMVDEIQRWVEFSRDSLEEFISDIIDIASQGERVSQIFSTMVSRVVSIDFCDSNSTSVWAINNPVNETLKSAMTYGLLKLANLSHVKYSDAYDWHVNKGLCECIINIQSMYSAFDSLTITIAEDQTLSRDQVRSNNFFMMAVLSVSFFVVIEVILNIALTLTIFELNKLLRTMADVDKQSRETASLPFKKSTNSEQETLNQTKAKRSISPPFLYFNVIFFGIFSVILFIVIIAIIEQKNQDFSSLNQWLFFGITRGNYMVETIVFTILDIFVSQQPGITQMIDHETSHSLATKLLGTLTTYNNFILRGYGDLPPCIGQNARLDHLHFADDCHGNLNLGGLHDLYRCASLDRGINLFAVWVQEMLDDPLNVTLKPDSTFYHVFHLMNDHLIDPCYEATTILSQLASNAIVEFHTLISIISFAGIAILLLVFILFFYNLSRLDVAFDGALQLLRRLPPLSVVSNLPLLNYLLNKKDEKVSGKMTVSKLIIHNSKNAVICLNRNETIDVVNKQVTSIFGYTPEQLLGQPISTIVPTEENSKVYEQIEFMRNGEAPLTFEGSFKGITDDETFLPIHLTLIGITDDNNSSSKVARSFVVIMDDETEFLRQQAEAEEAKKNSENLLYQILPRDIVTRLNHGETDISFSVPSASVIFVDIVKFSEYSATLTPAQIMENLSKVFACFDNCIAKYSLMTKIKLIGDVYMAAANLFTPDEPVQNHASQTVQFGLDVLAGLEEVNTQLDSSLQVRIGINTDGPLIAGVLGTDKPVFDIIGDPINVAARLQSNGIPGTVQISQTTYEAINGMNFNIEERGLVMLKGKGKKMAYIVRPTDQSSFFIGSVHELPTYNTSSNPPTAPNPT